MMFRTALSVSSSLTRRLFIANTTVQASTSSSAALKTDKVPPIKVALCIQRYAQLSPDMTQLEKDYSDMVTQLEMESSYLSDHELRHKRELEMVKQKQTSPTSATTTTNVIETAVDLEDRLAKEFEKFQFTSRETEDDKTNNLRSHHRKLDQNLLLIVQQKNSQSNKNEWIFPEKNYEGEPSLRAAAEQLISTCGNLHVQISGNAPLAWYKNEADASSKKIFFYKAEYLAGAVKQFTTVKSSPYQDHAWITHEDLPKYLSPTYYKAVKDMLFAF